MDSESEGKSKPLLEYTEGDEDLDDEDDEKEKEDEEDDGDSGDEEDIDIDFDDAFDDIPAWMPWMPWMPWISFALGALVTLADPVAAKGDPSCWLDGVTWPQCCAPQHGPEGNPGCWGGDFTFERCCIDANDPKPDALVSEVSVYPDCTVKGVVLRHAGEHAIFADLSHYGHSGCFLNDCKLTDKFEAVDPGICARACAATEECSHWSYGQQYGTKKCFLRKSDEGRASLPHWTSGVKACAPAPLPPAAVALRVGLCEAVKKCDAGKGDECPNVAAAINTWIFGIENMKRAFRGRVDPDTWNHVERIGKESENFLLQLTSPYRPSDKDFPRIIYNNRLIFSHLEEALTSQTRGVSFSSEDASLPNPLRYGSLVGVSSVVKSPAMETSIGSPVSPVSPATAALERAARLSDEAMAAQLQQFLDRWHFQVLTSSMGQSWNRLEALTAAMQMLAYGGVPLTEAEIMKLPRMEEEYMIDYLVDKMDETVRERFDEMTEDYAELITATSRIRSVLDLRGEQEILEMLDNDSSEICEHVLKNAVLTAGEKVVHLHRCQNTWVNNMESRLDRLTRAAEIAETAQKQLLVVEARRDPGRITAGKPATLISFGSAICMLETTSNLIVGSRPRCFFHNESLLRRTGHSTTSVYFSKE
eukprot:symbB.v1.2.016096.t1/scaffold1215.1/size131139/6